MRCVSNGKQMYKVKDDQVAKMVEQGWYVVTKNDYKRWLTRQQKGKENEEKG